MTARCGHLTAKRSLFFQIVAIKREYGECIHWAVRLNLSKPWKQIQFRLVDRRLLLVGQPMGKTSTTSGTTIYIACHWNRTTISRYRLLSLKADPELQMIFRCLRMNGQ